MDGPGKALCDKYNPREIKKCLMTLELTDTQIKTVKMRIFLIKWCQQRLNGMESTSTSTSKNQNNQLSLRSNAHIQHYNHEQFEQVFLQNIFNELHHKYQNTDARFIFLIKKLNHLYNMLFQN